MDNQSSGWSANRVSGKTSWTGPRTVVIPKTDRGFGFTLRHFIVYPPGPQEREYTSGDDEDEELYFQRFQHGNLEPLDTIFVKNVKEGGPAHKAGLTAGDRIISVNEEPVTGKSYGQVIKLIQQSSSDLSLLVVPKEEDILQVAYQNSAQSFDQYGLVPDAGGRPGVGGVKASQYPTYTTQLSMDNPSYRASRDRKVLSTSSLDTNLFESGGDPYERVKTDSPRRTLTTSTSYTSGLSVFRDQVPQEDNNMNKAVFLDRRREFETRSAQENVNPNSAKNYSFGLYFPKKESTATSSENLTRSVVVRRSRESVLKPTDSQENISKLQSRTRSVPIEYRHSGTPDQRVVDRYRSSEAVGDGENKKQQQYHGQSTSIRHSFPDSGVPVWTSPVGRRSSETTSPYGFDHGTPTPDNINNTPNKRDSYNSARQYVPVINETGMSRSQKMSASVDSIDPRSNVYHTENVLRTTYNNHSPEQPNLHSSSRTFIVTIGDSPDRSNTPSNQASQSGSHSYGAAFALTRSPASTEIEIRQKNEPRILVSHRKKQFEKRPESSPTPLAGNLNQSRYKTEIEKITTFRKFDGVQSRLASYEKNSNNGVPTEPSVRSRSQTPVSSQPISKVRRMSQERVKSPEPSQSQNTQGSNQSNFSDAAPIRIYVSQGTSSSSGSPIVEIVPMQSSSYEITDSRNDKHFTAHLKSPEQPCDLRDQTDSEGVKPVRKASFLSAVNAPYSRYLPQTGYENEAPAADMTPKSSRVIHTPQQVLTPHREGTATPTNYQWSVRTPSPARAMSPSSLGQSSTSLTISTSSMATTPTHDVVTPVRMRNKPEISAEDYETKLHRRTSYLMATAKDRSTVSLTMAPNAPGSHIDPNSPGTLSKHKSMSKLKNFFGEKTPKIVEATEKKENPASPIQQVTREGSLMVKVDMIDGKRASDRSWRPVWAVLRGHALFLCKEKRDPSTQTSVFSYDEQPISVKSCMIDIAHSYTKKKHVFRMKTYNGSEYLFQAEDHTDMLGWIEAIKRNNNPDSDSDGVTNKELIIRKTMEVVEAAPSTKTSPPPSIKLSKKSSVLSIKQKMPHSPNLKRRKTTSDKDDSGKPKTWKGKIGKSFKKQFGSSPSSSGGNIPPVQEVSGMFGVPLEDCTPSPSNEFVPLIVDVCTKIVEAKGLEMTGVYRIPGNKAGVTLLQEEFNKGIEAMNLDLEKWSDVNVISSLLKSFFRQLPEPLIPDELYQLFIDANRIDDPERRMLKLKRLIHKLPEHHFETFKHLAKHLNKVALYGDINRMEAKNLAIVFGPTLIRKADDNMVAMFTDMSDHCKIIESIILHCDWFFGSWDMDNYVPTDDDATECTSIMSGSAREDSDNLSLNPLDIVSSIVEAANRKLRGESQEHVNVSKTSVVISEPPLKYNERNIDQEIVLRTRKVESTSRSSPNLAAMQRTSDIVKTATQEITSNKRMAKSQDFCEFSDFDYIDSEKEGGAFLSPTTRYFSDDSLLDKNDELELSHSMQSSACSRSSREMLEGLWRIENEVRALREMEKKRQRDLEKRKLEKQRIDQDILQTKQELENEDHHSVEDLLNAHYSSTGDRRKPDTSPYRSNGNGKQAPRFIVQDSAGGGKYFVIKGNSPSSYDRSSRPPKQMSVESLVAQSKRTSSLENMMDPRMNQRGHVRPHAHVRAQKADHDRSKRDSAEIKRRSAGIGRSNSVRRGSLDSLIDLIEKRDNRMSWASTDSDEGLDLLATLTSTFDQKLLTLSSQKPSTQTTTGPLLAPRRINYTSSSSSLNTNSSSAGTDLVESSPSHSAQHRLPPQAPLSLSKLQGTSASDPPAKQYRDPSLHRTPPKPDTKIGLATRFERSTTHNPGFDGQNEYLLPSRSSGVNLNSDMTYLVESADVLSSRLPERDRDRDAANNNSQVSSVMVVISSPSVMSADSSKSSAYTIPQFVTKPMVSASVTSKSKWESYAAPSPSRSITRPITKSEKTEVNFLLSQSSDKTKTSESFMKKSSSSNQFLSSAGKSRSESPTPSNRKRVEKRGKRRHTVGGLSDSEHIRAVSEVTQKGEQRLSAWEQLRPAVSQNSNIGPNSSMLTWLRNERLRGSSPDLSSTRPEKNNGKKN